MCDNMYSESSLSLIQAVDSIIRGDPSREGVTPYVQQSSLQEALQDFSVYDRSEVASGYADQCRRGKELTGPRRDGDGGDHDPSGVGSLEKRGERGADRVEGSEWGLKEEECEIGKDVGGQVADRDQGDEEIRGREGGEREQARDEKDGGSYGTEREEREVEREDGKSGVSFRMTEADQMEGKETIERKREDRRVRKEEEQREEREVARRKMVRIKLHEGLRARLSRCGHDVGALLLRLDSDDDGMLSHDQVCVGSMSATYV